MKSFIALVLLKLPNTDAVAMADSDKRVSLLQHLDITVIKNVYSTGPLDVFHQKCPYFSIEHNGWMTQ
jgi:hypothetical protein